MAEKTKKRIPCEVYSRIVGYLRPVQNWNKGKRQEFSDRQTYRVEMTSEK
jgi:anaerobic ribonucleoside-triphosphate reductase